MKTLDFFDIDHDASLCVMPDTQPDASLESAFGYVDWNFPHRNACDGIESVHPYPAKFIAEIPRSLLKLLPVSGGDVVLDPFCGSGTTLVEAQAQGYPSIGIDLNPIACLISRVKTTTLPQNFYQCAQRVVYEADRLSNKPRLNIPNVDHWFQSHIKDTLAALTTVISDAPDDQRDFLRLSLSSIIVRVSNQESDTRYAAIQKNVTVENVYKWFLQKARKLSNVLSTRGYPLAPAEVIEADTLTVTKDTLRSRVGLVITSPPYPNAYEYWLYHKYRMWWLNFDPIAVKRREIGARAHFFKKNRHTEQDFAKQMTRTFALIEEVLCEGGHVCFVVGRSIIHGKFVDNAGIIQNIATRLGFSVVFKTERVIPSNSKSFNLSHASIKKETLIILRKG